MALGSNLGTMDDRSCIELTETALASVNIMWAPLPDGSPTLLVANLMVKAPTSIVDLTRW
ncbi:hypothetical protein E4U09_003954 [Claviceps aff. purpurea]|uniref:Uncharacterized protein n=1 Tax=Claviceps aff. purpurea TaxID=1967640 RepID=A0A9P7U0S4_9HYPO|nr:hypothetical protein E4U09_003954 [Claviceps aff. purpurea]